MSAAGQVERLEQLLARIQRNRRPLRAVPSPSVEVEPVAVDRPGAAASAPPVTAPSVPSARPVRASAPSPLEQAVESAASSSLDEVLELDDLAVEIADPTEPPPADLPVADIPATTPAASPQPVQAESMAPPQAPIVTSVGDTEVPVAPLRFGEVLQRSLSLRLR